MLVYMIYFCIMIKKKKLLFKIIVIKELCIVVVLLQAVEALFRCNVARMPSFLHNSGFITWATKMIRQRGAYEDNHVTDVLECYQRELCIYIYLPILHALPLLPTQT